MTARIVIAASRSGEGKTTLTVGLARALRDRGLRVATAKVGPDYLDADWHQSATGVPARNLDIWMMGEAGVRRAFDAAARGADIVVIEGVMGLFDGHRLDPDSTSTAAVATLLDAPVLLALDASHSATTLAAVAGGLAGFDERVDVRGAVLNRFREGRERSAMAAAFERVGLPVLGWVPADAGAAIDSRHLGLQLARESVEAEVVVGSAARLVERYVDVDAVLAVAGSAANRMSVAAEPLPMACSATPVVAVAVDDAFAFYYPDNLEALDRAGARVVEFSPLRDQRLPDGATGLYLGGGYPELHAAELASNVPMLKAIRGAVEEGMPVFAECGGMLYLLESLIDGDGTVHSMAGVLPATATMTDSLRQVGYVDASLATDCVLGVAGTRLRGHEFRYSTCMPQCGESPAFVVAGEGRGFSLGSVVASYVHLNFAGCPQVADAFVESCRLYANHSVGGTDD